MSTLSPYMMFDGNCEAAMLLYAAALEGELTPFNRFSEGPDPVPDTHKDRIMHVALKFDGGHIMASDSMPNAPYTTDGAGSNIHLSLGFTDKSKMEKVFAKLADGGKVTMPLADQFWGDTFGMLVDKFGTHWMFNCAAKKK